MHTEVASDEGVWLCWPSANPSHVPGLPGLNWR